MERPICVCAYASAIYLHDYDCFFCLPVPTIFFGCHENIHINDSSSGVLPRTIEGRTQPSLADVEEWHQTQPVLLPTAAGAGCISSSSWVADSSAVPCCVTASYDASRNLSIQAVLLTSRTCVWPWRLLLKPFAS